MAKVLVDLALSPSLASTATRCVPAWLGVPLKRPSAGARRIPGGRRPRVSFHTFGATPPAVVRLGAVEATEFRGGQSLSANAEPWRHGERHRPSQRARFGVPRPCHEAVRPRSARCSHDRPSSRSRTPKGSFPATSSQEKMPDPPRARRVIRNEYPHFGLRRDSRTGGDPGLYTDLQRELLLRSLPCAVARVILRLAHLHVELEAPGLHRSAVQRAVLCKGQPWRQLA